MRWKSELKKLVYVLYDWIFLLQTLFFTKVFKLNFSWNSPQLQKQLIAIAYSAMWTTSSQSYFQGPKVSHKVTAGKSNQYTWSIIYIQVASGMLTRQNKIQSINKWIAIWLELFENTLPSTISVSNKTLTKFYIFTQY